MTRLTRNRIYTTITFCLVHVIGMMLFYYVIPGVKVAKAEEPQIIDIRVKEPEYVAVDPDMKPVTNECATWTAEDEEALAKLLWSSPLRSEDEKIKICWVVINRVNSRLSAFSKSTSIKKAINTHEFAFFDKKAHISEENRKIVVQTLRDYRDWFNGEDIGSHPSSSAVYISFYGEHNECITLYDSSWEPV